MKKSSAVFIALAALFVASCEVELPPAGGDDTPEIPEIKTPGVNIFSLSDTFVEKAAQVKVAVAEPAEEYIKVTIALDETASAPLTTEVIVFNDTAFIEKGETEAVIDIQLITKPLENGEYTAVIKIVDVEGAEIGERPSCEIPFVVEKKQKDAWTELPTFNSVETFPTIEIRTDDGQMPTRDSRAKTYPYKTGTVVFNDPDGMYSDVPRLELKMQVRGRGNTSWNNAKKGYKIKLDEKNKVFGMKGDRDWAILAEFSDGTLLRNQTAMQVSRIVGMSWTPACCSAEVTFNGTKLGMYTFIEHKEVGDSKIQMGPDGYYLELDDKEEDNDPRFTTPKYYKVIKYKDPEELSSAQQTYVKGFFTDLENTLASTNAATFANYKNMMDVDSFIRNFIVQELTKNGDGNLRLSTPLVLENDQLRCPSVWDFDLSLGNAEIDGWFPLEGVVSGTATQIRTTKAGDGPTGWFVKCAGGRPYGYENPNKQTAWYQRMWTDPEFVARLKEIWNEVYPGLLTVPGYIDALHTLYTPAIEREWTIWKNQNRSNRSGAHFNTPETQYQAMRKFYTDRLEWMNTAVNAL